MKKIVLVAFVLLASFFTNAQTNNNNYIEVTGEVTYNRKPKTYIAEVMISKDFCYSYDGESINFEELKNNFFQKVKDKGIDQTKFTENKLEFLVNNYRNKGSFYKFTTKNKEELIKLLKIRANGIQFRNQMVSFKDLTTSEAKELKQKALKNAKIKAEEYATIINKKVGEVLYIKDYNYSNVSPESLYYSNYQKSYKVTVAYSLK